MRSHAAPSQASGWDDRVVSGWADSQAYQWDNSLAHPWDDSAAQRSTAQSAGAPAPSKTRSYEGGTGPVLPLAILVRLWDSEVRPWLLVGRLLSPPTSSPLPRGCLLRGVAAPSKAPGTPPSPAANPPELHGAGCCALAPCTLAIEPADAGPISPTVGGPLLLPHCRGALGARRAPPAAWAAPASSAARGVTLSFWPLLDLLESWPLWLLEGAAIPKAAEQAHERKRAVDTRHAPCSAP